MESASYTPRSPSDSADRPSFLASHRAHPACVREIARLTDALCSGATSFAAERATEKLEIRLTPDRCILQLGPVALTVAWLRGTSGTVEGGELLVIVWQGVISSRSAYRPPMPGSAPSRRTATVLWEETFTVTAEDEPSWLWRPHAEDAGGYSSRVLAERCVDGLGSAYESLHLSAVPAVNA